MDEELKQTETEPTKDCPQCAEYLAGWKRAQADYANLKKETEKDRMEFSKFANERLLSSLIPAIDQFETALGFVPDTKTLPDEQRKPIDNWITGMRAVRSLWSEAFKEIGLESFEKTGEFDPQQNEAVGQEASESVSEGQIVRTIQLGWKLNGKLLRPSKVIISKSVVASA
jgi:molecular chaperone GrpE